ncbi:MAG: galactokinase [Planctomycetota bacterium]
MSVIAESSGTSSSPSTLIERVIHAFTNEFGSAPSLVALAPGRVNLIGEHIDYNDGFVLPMAIDRYVAIAAAPHASSETLHDRANVASVEMGQAIEIPVSCHASEKVSSWGKYIQGVIAGFCESGIQCPSFNAVVASDVPQGGGLSSSAALEVATATMVEGLTGHSLDPVEKSLLCQKAEHEYAGVPCGIMDQFSSVFGRKDHLLLIDCRSHESKEVPFEFEDIEVLITNSNVKHELSGGEYASRRSDCESALAALGKSSWRLVQLEDLQKSREHLTEAEFRRGRHVITEIARTTRAANALRTGDLETVGKLMFESHKSLKDDFKVSCDELDLLVEIAADIQSNGVEKADQDRPSSDTPVIIGSRMTGGGFGGCTVSLVQRRHTSSVIRAFGERYFDRTGLECSCFSTRPAGGAHLIEC